MRNFWGYYCNGRYQVGLTGTVWVYDMEDRLIGRFTETPNSYCGAFVPGTDIFVSHSNECHLVVYDIAHMKLLKKIKTSNCHASESDGMAFSNDGKRLYCIQAQWNTELDHKLVVYDTDTFEVIEEYFDHQRTLFVQDIEIESDGTCYIGGGERDAASGVLRTFFVGIFRDGEIVDRRTYEENWKDVCMYFMWKRSGCTEKAFHWFLEGKSHFLQFDPRQERSSLKKLYETGRL